MKTAMTFFLFAFAPFIFADNATIYNASFENAVHHEARISATFSDIKSPTLEVMMSRSSPGRYALHEFAKNVYHVSAVDSKGDALPITRPNAYQWNVGQHDGQVTISYTLFGDRADGTYSQIDRSHAHLNIPATFMWAKGYENVPIELTLKPFNDSWKVATQLVKTNRPYVFTAPGLSYFMDSPIEFSDHQVSEWSVKRKNKDYRFKLAVHHEGSDDDLAEFTRRAKAVIEEQEKVFGEFPEFDYGEYVFIACYLPHVDRDGMEHRNSTILTNSTSLDEGEFEQLGTLSHEFFHAWNVERIRPKSLEPFDFTKANPSKSLWFAEGFTSYYGDLLIRRAQITSHDEYLEVVSTIINQANLVPGSRYFSPEGASMLAPFTDAGTSIDKTNFRNIFFSYYIYGRAMALALDLSIRSQFPGKSLDDYLELMWQEFGREEKPYDRSDLQITLAKLLGDKEFSDTFFANHIRGQKIPDFKKLIAPFGLKLTKKEDDKTYVGPIDFNFNGESAIVSSVINVATPLYEVGIERGDQIVKLGRRTIRSKDLWEKALEQFKPAESATIEYIQRGIPVQKTIHFVSNPATKIRKKNEEESSEEDKARLLDWLNSDDKGT
jgi:predicted metalloprotease with PDZ domain